MIVDFRERLCVCVCECVCVCVFDYFFVSIFLLNTMVSMLFYVCYCNSLKKAKKNKQTKKKKTKQKRFLIVELRLVTHILHHSYVG